MSIQWLEGLLLWWELWLQPSVEESKWVNTWARLCFLYPRKSQHHPQKTLTTTEGNSRKVGGAEKYPSRTIRAITPFQ
jgi:hypothetical protein